MGCFIRGITTFGASDAWFWINKVLSSLQSSDTLLISYTKLIVCGIDSGDMNKNKIWTILKLVYLSVNFYGSSLMHENLLHLLFFCLFITGKSLMFLSKFVHCEYRSGQSTYTRPMLMGLAT